MTRSVLFLLACLAAPLKLNLVTAVVASDENGTVSIEFPSGPNTPDFFTSEKLKIESGNIDRLLHEQNHNEIIGAASSRQTQAELVKKCESGWPASIVTSQGELNGGPTSNVGILIKATGVPSGHAQSNWCTASWIDRDLLVTAARCAIDFVQQDGVITSGLYVALQQSHMNDGTIYYYRVSRAIYWQSYDRSSSFADLAVIQTATSREVDPLFRLAWRPDDTLSGPRFVVGYPNALAGIFDGYSKVVDYIDTVSTLVSQTLFKETFTAWYGMSGSPIIRANRENVSGAPLYSFYAIYVALYHPDCEWRSTRLGGNYNLDGLVVRYGRSVRTGPGNLHWVDVL